MNHQWTIQIVSAPHQIHQHSHGLHHTSTCRRYSGHLCKQTHSLNTAEALEKKKDGGYADDNNISAFNSINTRSHCQRMLSPSVTSQQSLHTLQTLASVHNFWFEINYFTNHPLTGLLHFHSTIKVKGHNNHRSHKTLCINVCFFLIKCLFMGS